MTHSAKSHAGRLFLLLSLLLLIAGQLSAKYGALLNAAGRGGILYLLLSYGCLLLRGMSWTAALHSLPLSLAYPVLAAAYPLVLGLSALLFAEQISRLQVLAAAVIALGVILVSLPRQERQHG